ncbi:PRC-barrel domain-containing protein [Jiella marina]|uniref:PRC-barrel domain-containing protein n=1 Tax=Jiella sp. LLJ827 TaxID=2917712 RepID=UPI002101A7EB|nr:PRC-barrel domain-containing protein [Jiella sp. LLJ827]MCQ0986548.1 PRC-barrel domain-containing protein [Jiella sp. LLJ827]
MIRKLLATTAIAAVLTAPGAMAQDSSATDTQTQQPAATQGSSSQEMDATGVASEQQASAGNYLQNLSSDQYLASNLTGQSLYGSEGEDAESIGDIQNFLVGSDGKVVAAVVSATVEDESKVVAIPFDQIGWTMDQDNEVRAVLKADPSELASAPTFMTPAEQEAQAQQQQAASTDSTGMAPETGTGMASTDAAGSGAASGSSDQQMASDDSENMADGKTDRQTASSEGSSGDYPASVGSDQYLTENLIGTGVYTGPGEDAEDIGGINDLVFASSGDVDAAVIGVGGFLGIGEKEVGVPFDRLEMTRNEDQEPLITAALTREDLEQAPDFSGERSSQQMAEGEAQQPADDGSQTGDQMAAATGAAAGSAAGAADQAGENMEQAADNAGQAMENAGEAAVQTADNAADEAGEAMNEAGQATEQAANEAGQAMDNAADEAAQTADNAADETGEAMNDAAQATEQAANEAGQAMENAGDQAAQTADNAADSMTAETDGAMAQNDSGMATTGTMGTSGDVASTASTGGSDLRSQLSEVEDNAQLTADDLMGTTVYGPNDETVGEIGDIAMSAEGQVDAVIIDVGGFLGIGEKPVAVGMDNLSFMRDNNGSLYLYTEFTEDQLDNAPEYNSETYAENRDTMRIESNSASGSSSDPAGTAEAN